MVEHTAAEPTVPKADQHGPSPKAALNAALNAAALAAEQAALSIVDGTDRANALARIRAIRDGNGGNIAAIIASLNNIAAHARDTSAEDLRQQILNILESQELTTYQQAQVNARVQALAQGRIADYYRETFCEGMDANTAAFVSAQVEKDPVAKATAEAARELPAPIVAETEKTYELRGAFLKEKIATTTGDEHAEWQRVAKFHLMRDPALAKRLVTASPEQLHAIVEEGLDQRAAMAAPTIDEFGANTLEGAILRRNKTYSSDGHGLSARKIIEDAESPEVQAALKEYAIVRDYNKMAEPQRSFAAVGMIAQRIKSNYGYQTNIIEGLQKIHAEEKAGEVGHENNFQRIIKNKTLPIEERAKLLIDEMQEHTGQTISVRAARRMIENIDLLPNPEQSILGLAGHDYKTNLRLAKIENGLAKIYDESRAQSVLKIANNDPSNLLMLEGALRALDPKSTKYDDTIRAAIREQLDRTVTVASDPAFADSISRINYYNLADSAAGRQVALSIQTGQLSAEQASVAVKNLQAQALRSMESLAPLVPGMLDAEYNSRLQKNGMFKPDGTLDVEKLIEQARINRDKLGPGDKAVKGIADKEWSTLTETEKDTRVIARAAIRFKAMEAIQTFGREINDAFERIGRDETLASPQLKADLEQYRMMLGEQGTPKEQHDALDALLQKQQYLRVKADLREEVVGNIITLNQQNPGLLQGTEFLTEQTQQEFKELTNVNPSAQPPAGAPVVPTVPAFTAEQVRELNKEGAINSGDLTFENHLEDRLKKAFKGHEMQEIVAKLGPLMGQFNVGRQDYISVNEVENALQALAPGKSSKEIVTQMDTDKDGRLSLDEVVAGLKNSNITGMQNAGAAPTELATTPTNGVKTGVSAAVRS